MTGVSGDGPTREPVCPQCGDYFCAESLCWACAVRLRRNLTAALGEVAQLREQLKSSSNPK